MGCPVSARICFVIARISRGNTTRAKTFGSTRAHPSTRADPEQTNPLPVGVQGYEPGTISRGDASEKARVKSKSFRQDANPISAQRRNCAGEGHRLDQRRQLEG